LDSYNADIGGVFTGDWYPGGRDAALITFVSSANNRLREISHGRAGPGRGPCGRSCESCCRARCSSVGAQGRYRDWRLRRRFIERGLPGDLRDAPSPLLSMGARAEFRMAGRHPGISHLDKQPHTAALCVYHDVSVTTQRGPGRRGIAAVAEHASGAGGAGVAGPRCRRRRTGAGPARRPGEAFEDRRYNRDPVGLV